MLFRLARERLDVELLTLSGREMARPIANYSNRISPDVYTNSFLLPAGSGISLTYKYSQDGFDDENGFQTNHIRYVRSIIPVPYSFPEDQWSWTVCPPGTPYPNRESPARTLWSRVLDISQSAPPMLIILFHSTAWPPGGRDSIQIRLEWRMDHRRCHGWPSSCRLAKRRWQYILPVDEEP